LKFRNFKNIEKSWKKLKLTKIKKTLILNIKFPLKYKFKNEAFSWLANLKF